MAEAHPTVPSVKMIDTLASYIYNYFIFQVKLNLKIEN